MASPFSSSIDSEPAPSSRGQALAEGFRWVSSRRPQLGVFLSAPLTSPAQAKGLWLVQLRWLALAGMAATVAIARLLVPGLRLLPLVAILVLVALANLGWRRSRPGDFVLAQILVDLGLLTALLASSGGLHNPFAIFLTFQIALAGALCDGRATLRVAVATAFGAAVLAFVPPLPLEAAPLGAARLELLGRLAAIVSLGLFLGAFAAVYARKLHDLREQSERNERLAMIGRFAAGMSHELATPLGTILLGSRDLAESTRGGDPETAELASAIASEAERAGEIIDLLRGQARPDQRVELVDLAALVPEIVRRELDRLGFPGARVVHAPAPVPAPVLRVALGQVLRNLLANAVQATADARPPADRRIEVAVSTRGPCAEVSVGDNGPGFSPEIAGRLGEPFQTTKDVGEGLGLGLHVCAVLARQMGATLRAEDAVGGGARVTLTLDVALSGEKTA